MDINEIREKIKSNDCNTDDLLNAIQNLRNENSNDEILHELDLLENKVRSSQTNFDDKNDPDRVPITLDNMLPNYRLDKENMRYIDEKTGNTVSYDVSKDGRCYGIATKDKDGNKREPTKEELTAMVRMSGFKKASVSLTFSPATLALMKEVCSEHGVTITNLDQIDEKIKQSMNEQNNDVIQTNTQDTRRTQTQNHNEKKDQVTDKEQDLKIRLAEENRKLANALQQISKIPDPKKREAAKNLVLAKYSAKRDAINNECNESKKIKRSNTNNKQQTNQSQIPNSRDGR